MLWKLFKIQMVSCYRNMFLMGRNREKKKKNPLMVVFLIVLALYVCASVMLTSAFMFYNMAGPLIAAGQSWFYFAIAGIMSFGMSVVLTIFMTQSVLYEARDNDLLLSLPIKPSHILGSRLAVIAVFDYAASLLFLVGAGVVYAYVAKPPLLYYVFFILGALLLPLLGMVVSALAGYLLTVVTARMHNRTLVTTLFSLVILGGYIWWYQTMMRQMTEFTVANTESLGATIQTYLLPFRYFGESIAGQDVFSLVLFALCCTIPFALMHFFLSVSFIKLATTGRHTKKIAYRREAMAERSAVSALFRKEVRKFLNTPMYLLNSGFSFILNIILGVFFYVRGVELFASLTQSMPQITQYISVSVTFALCFLACMGITTSSSISLEGQKLWVLRSAPVKTSAIFRAKLWMNILFGGVTLLFADICIIIKLGFTLPEALFLVVLTLGVQIFAAVEGLLCNLMFPKLDAANDNVIIKQSASVMVSMLVSFGLMLTLSIGYVVLTIFLPGIYFAWILAAESALVFLLNFAAYRLLMTKGVKIFERL